MGMSSTSQMRNVTVVLYEAATGAVRCMLRTRPELVAEEVAKPEFAGLDALTIVFPLVPPKGRWAVDVERAASAKKAGEPIVWSDVMVAVNQEVK